MSKPISHGTFWNLNQSYWWNVQIFSKQNVLSEVRRCYIGLLRYDLIKEKYSKLSSSVLAEVYSLYFFHSQISKQQLQLEVEYCFRCYRHNISVFFFIFTLNQLWFILQNSIDYRLRSVTHNFFEWIRKCMPKVYAIVK